MTRVALIFLVLTGCTPYASVICASCAEESGCPLGLSCVAGRCESPDESCSAEFCTGTPFNVDPIDPDFLPLGFQGRLFGRGHLNTATPVEPDSSFVLFQAGKQWRILPVQPDASFSFDVGSEETKVSVRVVGDPFAQNCGPDRQVRVRWLAFERDPECRRCASDQGARKGCWSPGVDECTSLIRTGRTCVADSECVEPIVPFVRPFPRSVRFDPDPTGGVLAGAGLPSGSTLIIFDSSSVEFSVAGRDGSLSKQLDVADEGEGDVVLRYVDPTGTRDGPVSPPGARVTLS